MDNDLNYITPITFYGNKSVKKIKKSIEKSYNESSCPSDNSFDLKRLLGPTSTWKVFKKQSEALNFTKLKRNGLMAFVFQQPNGERLFLAAHPRWLWHYDSKKQPRVRSSYEIISEYTVCKLYFDLEFDITVNQNHNGVQMLNIFISIIIYYIKSKWELNVDKQNIIDLDSSTDSKFSRHLIFNLPNTAFCDNYTVGRFVKYVCNEIKCCLDNLNENIEYEFMKELRLNRDLIDSLKVKDSKNKTKLFCDEGVYTKNRHFRLYKSTKPGKNAPLILSKENEYQPKKMKLKNIDEQIFLDSLITYVPDENIKILYFDDGLFEKTHHSKDKKANQFEGNSTNNCVGSPYSKIDEFIGEVVSPGRIWRTNYFQTTNVIVYDIIENRFCGNIGRQHRSNNIKQVVDVNNRCYYQKCYDPECINYRSDPKLLPPTIQFYLDDEIDNCILEADNSFEFHLDASFDEFMDDKELADVLDIIEDISCSHSMVD